MNERARVKICPDRRIVFITASLVL